MTSIDPTEASDEEKEEAILDAKRKQTKYGHLIDGDGS